jgi:hypothetical protein
MKAKLKIWSIAVAVLEWFSWFFGEIFWVIEQRRSRLMDSLENNR